MSKAVVELSFRQRIALLLGLSIVVIVAVGIAGPVPQDPAYHQFADSRMWFGIPNFNDVVSNLGFALVGILGLLTLAGPVRQTVFAEPPDARPYLLFFLGIALLSLGSAYYHLAPSNDRLFWDRLPMSVAFMAISAAVVADRIDAEAGNGWLMLLLIAGGIASLLYWDWTETLGRGDLRPYAMVQFYPMLALPLVVALFPNSRYTAGGYLVWVIFWYGLAKVLEHFDGQVFDLLGHTVSGHTLKHLAAAVAPLVILRMLLSKRQRMASPITEH